MSYTVLENDILSVRADAVVIAAELNLDPAVGPVCAALGEAGGGALRRAMKARRFLPVGSAVWIDPGALPFERALLTCAPRWLTGKANELLVLRRCYESLYALCREAGICTLASPFLSAPYYRFPQAEAVHIALQAAAREELETVFVAGSPELLDLSRRPYRCPAILDYIGYYRDHAIFALDNGLFARVDRRPERRETDVIPYFEACYRAGNNPLQPPLPAAEIERLRRIYEEDAL